MAIAAALAASGVDFYMVLNGDDANPGAAKAFASLIRARDAVCSAKFRAPNHDCEFLLREGVHRLSETVVFSLADSDSSRNRPGSNSASGRSIGRKSASCPSTRFSVYNLSGSASTVVIIDRAFHPTRAYFFL